MLFSENYEKIASVKECKKNVKESLRLIICLKMLGYNFQEIPYRISVTDA